MAEQAAQLAKPDILINIPQNSAGAWDFHKGNDLIEPGRRAAIQELRNKK